MLYYLQCHDSERQLANSASFKDLKMQNTPADLAPEPLVDAASSNGKMSPTLSKYVSVRFKSL